MSTNEVLSLFSKSDESVKESLFKALLSKVTIEEDNGGIDNSNKEKLLMSALNNYVVEHDFNIGELVKWKPGLKNKTRPEHNEPAIVVEILDQAIQNVNSSPASPYYKENLNVRLGLIMSDGEFLTFYYDKHRFEPYIK